MCLVFIVYIVYIGLFRRMYRALCMNTWSCMYTSTHCIPRASSTARSVEDGTRNAKRNAKRNPNRNQETTIQRLFPKLQTKRDLEQ